MLEKSLELFGEELNTFWEKEAKKKLLGEEKQREISDF
jgi:hypothetical protein